MYQVIEMYGDNEPWWFFENWQADIQTEKDFSRLEDALTFFKKKAHELVTKYPQYKMQTSYLVAFWQENDLRWCEECDDDLQQYKGLLLLKDGQQLQETAPEITKAQHQTGQRCPYRKKAK